MKNTVRQKMLHIGQNIIKMKTRYLLIVFLILSCNNNIKNYKELESIAKKNYTENINYFHKIKNWCYEQKEYKWFSLTPNFGNNSTEIYDGENLMVELSDTIFSKIIYKFLIKNNIRFISLSDNCLSFTYNYQTTNLEALNIIYCESDSLKTYKGNYFDKNTLSTVDEDWYIVFQSLRNK